jgi:hypothetical protein
MIYSNITESLKELFKNKKGGNLTTVSGETFDILPLSLKQGTYGSMPELEYALASDPSNKKTITFSNIQSIKGTNTDLPYEVTTSTDFWKASIFSPMGLTSEQPVSFIEKPVEPAQIFTPADTPEIKPTKVENISELQLNKPVEPHLQGDNKAINDIAIGKPTVEQKVTTAANEVTDSLEKSFNEAVVNLKQGASLAEAKYNGLGTEGQKKLKKIGTYIGFGVLALFIFILLIVLGIVMVSSSVSGGLNADTKQKWNIALPMDDSKNKIDSENFLRVNILDKEEDIKTFDEEKDPSFSPARLLNITQYSYSSSYVDQGRSYVPDDGSKCVLTFQNLPYANSTGELTSLEGSQTLLDEIVNKVYAVDVNEATAAGVSTSAEAKVVDFVSSSTGNKMEMLETVVDDGAQGIVYAVRVLPSTGRAIVLANDCGLDVEQMQIAIPTFDYTVNS